MLYLLMIHDVLMHPPQGLKKLFSNETESPNLVSSYNEIHHLYVLGCLSVDMNKMDLA